MIRCCVVGLLLIVSAFNCKASEYVKQQPLNYSKYLSEIEKNMGQIRPDGLVNLNLSIESNNTLNLLGVKLTLHHFLTTDAYGNPRSAWKLSGLQSSIVLGDRGTLVWTRFSGSPLTFNSDDVSRSFSHAGQPLWLIRKPSEKRFEVRALDGRTWRYVNGSVESMQHPLLGRLEFEAIGSRVQRIYQIIDSEETLPIVHVAYNALGRPQSLQVNEQMENTFEWTNQEHLLLWKSFKGGSVTFSYEGALLTAMNSTKMGTRWFKWAQNPGHTRGDSRWKAAVHLAEDNENCYNYMLSSKGYVLTRINKASGLKTVTLFNPRRRRLEQKIGKGYVIAIFRGTGNRITTLAKIENDQNQVLELYSYDELGRLVAIKRMGEPEQRLSYDETGRLMTLEEGTAL